MSFHEEKKRHLWNLIIHCLADLLIAWTSCQTVLQLSVLFTWQANPLTCSSSSREILSSLSRSYRRKATGKMTKIYTYKLWKAQWAHFIKSCKCSRYWSPAPPWHTHVTELYTHRAACLSGCWVARWHWRSCSSHCPRLVWSEPRSAWSPWSLPGPL